jgi:phosphoribosylamine---glycine ligase
MNVLILGSGGRENAFAELLSRSTSAPKLFIGPGNGGSDVYAERVELNLADPSGIAAACKRLGIHLVLIGPEQPLVEGLVDYLNAHLPELMVIGPTASAARLEGSKAFSKVLMQKYGIPTARYRSFTRGQLLEALEYVAAHPLPVVIKADGLAAGKGVIISENTTEALETTRSILEQARFGEAGQQVVIEEFLKGIELSVFILTDGQNFVLLPEAKDYKRVADGDQGPNTGGMGAVSPVPFFNEELREKVERKIIRPTLEALQSEGIFYSGFIFFGLMKVNQEPYLIEYNCRMGDPETEAVLPRIDSDFMELLLACAGQRLGAHAELKLAEKKALTVIVAAKGYPDAPEKGKKIVFTQPAGAETLVFHAGTRKEPDGSYLSSGGRVLAITSLADDLEAAAESSYQYINTITFEGATYRKDIGQDIINYIRKAEH